jgi:hypothetical protein
MSLLGEEESCLLLAGFFAVVPLYASGAALQLQRLM